MTSTVTIEDLEKLVFADELTHIENELAKFNIFTVLKVSHLETIHSNFLAWLLHPQSNHGMLDYPLKSFLKHVFRKHRIYENHHVSVVDLDIWDMTAVSVEREKDHIDLLMIDEKNNFLCLIENKIRHKQGKNQLTRYKEAVNLRYKDISEKIFLLLTVDGDDPNDDEYYKITYEDVRIILDSIYESKKGQLTDEVKYFIENYIKTLKGQILENSKLKELSQQIYHKHKPALDYIFENKPDEQQAIRNFLEEWVKNNPNYKLDNSHKSRTRFIPYSLEPKIPKDDALEWTKTGNMLLYEFHNEPSKLDFCVYIGPGSQDKRNSLYQFAKKNDDLFKNAKKPMKTSKYFDLFRKSVLTKNDFAEKTEKEILESLIQKLELLQPTVEKITITLLGYQA